MSRQPLPLVSYRSIPDDDAKGCQRDQMFVRMALTAAKSSKLGAGAFGQVWSMQEEQQSPLHDAPVIAVKWVPKRRHASRASGDAERKDYRAYKQLLFEMQLLLLLEHPNIIALVRKPPESLQGKCVLVMEHMSLGDLSGYLVVEKDFLQDPKKRYGIVCDVARGVQFLHGKSILHRDLKPQNVLLESLGSKGQVVAKLSDFGTASILQRSEKTRLTHHIYGTPVYLPPECVVAYIEPTPEQRVAGIQPAACFSEKSDVFSLGIVMMEVLLLRMVQTYYTDNLSIRKEDQQLVQVETQSQLIKAGKFPAFSPEAAVLSICQLVSMACQLTPDGRPTASEFLAFLKSRCESETFSLRAIDDRNVSVITEAVNLALFAERHIAFSRLKAPSSGSGASGRSGLPPVSGRSAVASPSPASQLFKLSLPMGGTGTTRAKGVPLFRQGSHNASSL